MLPVSFQPIPRKKRQRNEEGIDITKFAKPLRMVDLPAARSQKPLPTNKPAVDKGPTHAVAAILITGVDADDTSKEVVSVIFSVRPGFDAKQGCYSKLTTREKELAVAVCDAHASSGHSLNESISAVKRLHPIFSAVCKASMARWRKEGEATHTARAPPKPKAGRPKLVSQAHRDGIKKDVRSSYFEVVCDSRVP